MLSLFHAQGFTFVAHAVECGLGWISTVDIVDTDQIVSQHSRLDPYPTQVAALLGSFADASHLASLVRGKE